jgi:hypothetical protein
MITPEQEAELRRLIALAIDAHGELMVLLERQDGLATMLAEVGTATVRADETAAAVDRYITSLVVAPTAALEPVVVVAPIAITRPVSSLPDAP